MTRFHPALTRPLIGLPRAAFAVVVAGIAALAMMPAPQATAAIVAAAQPIPVAAVAPVRERGCAACGIVETIRRTDPATGAATYAFVVRMHDGSTRASTQATRDRWLEGDQVLVIGGTAARALEQKKTAAL